MVCPKNCLYSHLTAGNLKHGETTCLKLLIFLRWRPCKSSHGFDFCCYLELKKSHPQPLFFFLFSISCSCCQVSFTFCYLLSKAKHFTGGCHLVRKTCPFNRDFPHNLGIDMGDEQLHFWKLSVVNHCQEDKSFAFNLV